MTLKMSKITHIRTYPSPHSPAHDAPFLHTRRRGKLLETFGLETSQNLASGGKAKVEIVPSP